MMNFALSLSLSLFELVLSSSAAHILKYFEYWIYLQTIHIRCTQIANHIKIFYEFYNVCVCLDRLQRILYFT